LLRILVTNYYYFALVRRWAKGGARHRRGRGAGRGAGRGGGQGAGRGTGGEADSGGGRQAGRRPVEKPTAVEEPVAELKTCSIFICDQ